MMNTEDPQDSTPEQPETGHVGHLLRRAREAHGLSITQVADNQHLRPAVIQSIEDGDYDKIGNELFLKGYVKAYAEQVELAPAPLLQQLNKELEPLRRKAEAAEHDSPLETIERKKRRKRRIARWVMIILVLGLVGYVVFQVFEEEIVALSTADDQTQEAPASTESSESSGNETQENNTQSDAAADQFSAESSGPQDSSGEPESGPLSEEANAGEESGQTGSVNSNMPGSDDTVQPTSVLSASSGPAMSNTQDSSTAGRADANAAEQASDVLQVEFTGNCWVSVENGDGDKVVASLKRAGETLRYEGNGPFKVVLGAADTASVTFNGDAVNLSQYPAPNNRVALTLGQ